MEWLTMFPAIGRFPQTLQTLDIPIHLDLYLAAEPSSGSV
jgi:hypothetical protein